MYLQDTRLDGGYENVPTVDIHTNQIGWEQHWLQILKDYVAPLNQKVFTGYYTEVSLLNLLSDDIVNISQIVILKIAFDRHFNKVEINITD